MTFHTVEKIGGTSMSDYPSVRDNIILRGRDLAELRDTDLYQRIFVVSAYGGITDLLLEHKKSAVPGVYSLFANGIEDGSWLCALKAIKEKLHAINFDLFGAGELLLRANSFIDQRIDSASECLTNLHNLCLHGHFSLTEQLTTVREMLASIGEAHSAWNTTHLLKRDGINARFIDLTGWNSEQHFPLDQRIEQALSSLDLGKELPIVTGYAHCEQGLMSVFDRGYSEMTFSRLAVLSEAREATIHKEFHLSSADPRLVGECNAVPIGRTNYDVADQLANLGMEAIHPKAAKGLRQKNIALRIKNTFEPDHMGTLITTDYVSDKPCVEIIAGCKGVYALEIFDQDMAGNLPVYDVEFLRHIQRFNGHVVAKDVNANTITHYLSCSLKTIKRIRSALEEIYPEAEINHRKVAIVSAIGSDLKMSGILAKTLKAVADSDINVQAIHQSMRQVDMQMVVDESDYDATVRSLHSALVEVFDHGRAICLAS